VANNKGSEQKSTEHDKLVEWEIRGDSGKSTIGLGILGTEIYHLDLLKTLYEIWEEFNGLFGLKTLNAKFFFKNKNSFFHLKMATGGNMSSHKYLKINYFTVGRRSKMR
jgi:hypothetical protein